MADITVSAPPTSCDTQALRSVRLLGELGEKFGRIHKLAVRSPAEAVRALCSQLEGFREYLAGEGRKYRVLVGKQAITKDDLQVSAGEAQTFTFVPVLTGGKGSVLGAVFGGAVFSGSLQVILGATLVVAGIFTGQAWLANIGVYMARGGVAQMLTKPPTANTNETKNNPSYIFNGGVNTTAQGQCVPVGYGRMRVGSAVISAGIYTSDIPA